MYRDSEWNYKDWNCDTYQDVEGNWCCDFWRRSDPSDCGEAVGQKKRNVEEEAKKEMDGRDRVKNLEACGVVHNHSAGSYSCPICGP